MDAELNPAQRLHALGQSLWLDSINRVMLRTGTLARYVRDLAVTGLTSNPTILGHATSAGIYQLVARRGEQAGVALDSAVELADNARGGPQDSRHREIFYAGLGRDLTS